MASPRFVMFPWTKHQSIVHQVFNEFPDIGIENFKILSMLLTNVHFAFTRSLACPGVDKDVTREDTTTPASFSVTA